MFVFCVPELSAQINRNRHNHNIALWGAGGYSNIFQNSDEINSRGRFAYGFGIGYEFHRRSFILQTGVEFQDLRGNLQLNNRTHVIPNLIDDEGHIFDGNFHFLDNNDRYSLGYLNIPLMLGFQWQRFYFLVGGKVGLNLFGRSNTESLMNPTRSYHMLIPGEIGNMPSQGLYPRTVNFSSDVAMGLNYMVSAEVGRVFRPNPERNSRFTYRLAIFADYGLANIHSNPRSEYWVLHTAPEPVFSPVLNSLVHTSLLENKALSTLFVGVRFTVLFQLPERRICLWNLCN